MKIRNSFVSNSSSSSYVAVVVRPPWRPNTEKEKEIKEKFDELVAALDLEDITESDEWGWYDNLYEKGCEDAGYGMYLHKESGLNVCISEDGIRWIGMEISEHLNQDYKVSECKQDVIEAADNLGVELDVEHVKFEVDEAGWG